MKSIILFFIKTFGVPFLLAFFICRMSPDRTYTWYYGILHGWFLFPDAIMGIFSNSYYAKAPQCTMGYSFFYYATIVIWVITKSVKSSVKNGLKKSGINLSLSYMLGITQEKVDGIRFVGVAIIAFFIAFIVCSNFSIESNKGYGMFAGFLHGCLLLFNWIRSWFFEGIYIKAPIGSTVYIISWWLGCFIGILFHVCIVLRCIGIIRKLT